MKPVQLFPDENGPWVVEIEEGDVTGCPDWCDAEHVGEYLSPGEAIAHTRSVEYNLVFAPGTTTKQTEGAGEAEVYVWQMGEDLTLSVLDTNCDALIEGLQPIGAYNLAVALREAALRACPFIQTHDDDMSQFAYKAPRSAYMHPQAVVRTAEAPKPDDQQLKSVKAA